MSSLPFLLFMLNLVLGYIGWWVVTRLGTSLAVAYLYGERWTQHSPDWLPPKELGFMPVLGELAAVCIGLFIVAYVLLIVPSEIATGLFATVEQSFAERGRARIERKKQLVELARIKQENPALEGSLSIAADRGQLSLADKERV